ncbi:hypothetical protein MJO28_011164, partial [Puccinia striiformis f. sp. tritici]
TEARQDELRETFSEELMRMNGRLAPVFLAHQKDLSGEGVVENPTTGMEFIHSLLSCSLAFDVLANNPEDLLSSDHSRSMLIETEIEHAVLNSESSRSPERICLERASTISMIMVMLKK